MWSAEDNWSIHSPPEKAMATTLFDWHREPSYELCYLAQPAIVIFGNGTRQTRQALVITDDRRCPMIRRWRERGRSGETTDVHDRHLVD